MKSGLSFLAILSLISATPAQSDRIDAIIADYRSACQEEGGRFTKSPKAVELVDLIGAGDLSTVLDASLLTCSSTYYFRCGTGGCGLYTLVEGHLSEFLVRGWKVLEQGSRPVLQLQVHGVICDKSGLESCSQSLTFDQSGKPSYE